jgi:hypothetical protein
MSKSFPDRSDRDSHTTLRGGWALTPVSEAVFGIKHRPDLEYFQECVRVEITASDSRNLVIGNHYFSPDVKVDIIKNNFFFRKCIRYIELSSSFAWGF